MKCIKCGRRNPPGTQYCQYCQEELEEEENKPKVYLLLVLSCLIILGVLLVMLYGKVNEKNSVVPVDKDKAYYCESIAVL